MRRLIEGSAGAGWTGPEVDLGDRTRDGWGLGRMVDVDVVAPRKWCRFVSEPDDDGLRASGDVGQFLSLASRIWALAGAVCYCLVDSGYVPRYYGLYLERVVNMT